MRKNKAQPWTTPHDGYMPMTHHIQILELFSSRRACVRAVSLWIMGGAAAGAMDANAFNAAVRSAHDGVFLPEVSTLTYQGNPIERLSKGFNLIHWKLGVLQCGSAGKPEICLIVYDSCGLRNQSKSGVFNEHSYHTGGPEDTHQVAVAAYAARGLGSLGDPDEVWVACFLKSCRDGQPRDHIAMDLIVVLDVSGSMTLGEFGHIWSMIYYMLYMLYRIEQQKISIYIFHLISILSITAACKMIWGHRVVMLQYRFSPLLSQFLFGSHSKPTQPQGLVCG